ncbi:hypothetical protein [Amycolatopsis sp. PS_44_ISF1]|uniref:helix-turn-helix domain-containing protein n=1 Tax=Amycolatopsis sp. PS_44_ISF1 TaxID=2974917 RepID=UPI0028DF34D7|nr:hypothetical protein [Amycolatopsis sp. PS_44_ISF1]MDT8912470.1 hypothetical protein [Amycolatopsis sp. PS_44_ISF1]
MASPPESIVHAAELHRLLDQGPFAAALRAAIVVRGLSLDRVQDRLARRGVHLSVATLSYWQSGRRRPERSSSLAALADLETVLNLPPRSLSSLLAPSDGRRRGISADRFPSLEQLWATTDGVAALLPRLTSAAGDGLSRLSHHDRVRVDAAGRLSSIACRQTLRAERDGADRWPVVNDWGAPFGAARLVTGTRNCSLGALVADRSAGTFAAELVLERPLHRGEAVLIEYELPNPCPVTEPGRGPRRFVRRFRQPVRDYALEVCFDRDRIPVLCQQIGSAVGETVSRVVRSLNVGASGSALAVGPGAGPGRFGIRWFWD